MSFQNFWRILILSFYSPALYVMVAEKWRHWGLGFLIRLSTLVATISSIVLFISISSFDFNNPIVTDLLDQIPELKIEKNIAHLVDDKIKLPLRIKWLKANQDIIIVDLSITDAENYNQNVVVFTSDRISFNLINSSSIALPYADLLNNTNIDLLNTVNLITLLNEGKKRILSILLFLGIPVGSLLCFILALIRAVFYSSVANIVMRIFNSKLDFKRLIRLAVIANAPSMITSMIISVLFIEKSIDPVVQSIIGGLYIFYFIMAIMVCNKVVKH